MRKSEIFYISVFCVYLCCILYLCLGSFSNRGFNFPAEIFGIPSDKIAHLVMFMPVVPVLYPVLFSWKFSTSEGVFHTGGIILTIIAAATLAGGTELLQLTLTDYRSADIKDFYSDLIGIALGTMFGLPVGSIVYRRFIRFK